MRKCSYSVVADFVVDFAVVDYLDYHQLMTVMTDSHAVLHSSSQMQMAQKIKTVPDVIKIVNYFDAQKVAVQSVVQAVVKNYLDYFDQKVIEVMVES